MKILQVNELVKKQLRESGISKLMRSLESCKWIILAEKNEELIGAGGVGSIFNVTALQILPKYQGKGLGGKLLHTMIEEAKNRNYTFIISYVNQQNTESLKLHEFFGFNTIFRIHYSQDIVQNIMILLLKPRGKMILKILRFFNTFIGIITLALLLKLLKLFFKKLILYNEENVPEPSLKWIIKNFEKV